MHFSGIIVGAAVFFSIGICHPAVIKMEYYLGKKSWFPENPKRHDYYEALRLKRPR